MSLANLITRAQQIKNEILTGANSATRVGGLMEDTLNFIGVVELALEQAQTDILALQSAPAPTTTLIEDVTYAQLAGKIGSSTLSPGKFYRITDYRTIHYILDGQVTDSSGDTVVGEVEPLIVAATSVNTITTDAYSEINPNDLIRYDWNPGNWLQDTGFSITGVIIPGFRGVITYRKDTINNVETHYDWRNVKYRRWQINTAAFNTGTTYSKGQYSIHSGVLYVSAFSGNVGNTPVPENGTHWVGVADLTTPNILPKKSFRGLTASASYNDYFTFGEYTQIKNVCIESNSSGNTILNNITFIVNTGETPVLRNISIDSGCRSMTINGLQFNIENIKLGKSSFENIITSRFDNNVIGDRFNTNMSYGRFTKCNILDNCYQNYFGEAFIENTIGTEFYNNYVFDQFYYNTIGYSCRNNTFGAYAGYNSIGNHCEHNIIARGFWSNVCEEEFWNNEVGTGCINNHFGPVFGYYSWPTGTKNIIGNNCKGNTFMSDITAFQAGNDCQLNVLENGIRNLSVGNNFKNNRVRTGFNGTGIDFSGATHIYNAYHCELFLAGPTLSKKLSYIKEDLGFQLEIVDANA